MKAATLAGFAVYPYSPAHQLNKSRGNREAQSGAAILAGHRTVRLVKSFEDCRLLFGGNANACISNDEMEPNISLSPRFHLHVQDDLALFRKFDGVAN